MLQGTRRADVTPMERVTHRRARNLLPGWRQCIEYLVLFAVLFWVAVLAGGWPGG